MPKDYAVVTGLPSLLMYLKLLEIVGIIVGTKLDVEEELDFAANDLVRPILTKRTLEDLNHFCEQMMAGKLPEIRSS